MTGRYRMGPLVVEPGGGPLVMGIVNVTPDSFSDGGRFASHEAAVAQARALVAEGADILDIGGESSRPGYTPVDSAEELRRVLPVIEAAAGLGVPVSIDTMKAEVARAAVAKGASIVNDIWGLQRDPDMARVVAQSNASLVVMHNRDKADAAIDIFDEVLRFLERSLAIAEAHGIARERIAVDPGLGFGKTFEQNLALITGSRALHALGCPVLIGLSRKSFIGRMIDHRPVTERLHGSLSANLVAARFGADILRVHDVRPLKEALTVEATILEHARR